MQTNWEHWINKIRLHLNHHVSPRGKCHKHRIKVKLMIATKIKCQDSQNRSQDHLNNCLKCNLKLLSNPKTRVCNKTNSNYSSNNSNNKNSFNNNSYNNSNFNKCNNSKCSSSNMPMQLVNNSSICKEYLTPWAMPRNLSIKIIRWRMQGMESTVTQLRTHLLLRVVVVEALTASFSEH